MGCGKEPGLRRVVAGGLILCLVAGGCGQLGGLLPTVTIRLPPAPGARKALEILSREGDLNILVSPGVTGVVTANLKGVTPDQALDAVLRLAGLVARRDGNLVYVYTPDELNRGLGADQWVATHVYHLNY